MIFSKEDMGYEAGKDPTGHVKIEVRDGRGKVEAAIQNLKQLNNGLTYILFLLSGNEEKVRLTRVGEIIIVNGKGEIKWEFNPYSTMDYNSSNNNFSAAVVLVEGKEALDERIICPLAAYKGKKFNWKEAVRKGLYLEKEEKEDKKEKEIHRVINKEENWVVKEAESIEEVKHEIITPEKLNEDISEDLKAEDLEDMDKDLEKHEETADLQVSKADEVNEDPIENANIDTNINIERTHNNIVEPASTEPIAEQKCEMDIQDLKMNFNKYFEKYEPFVNRRKDYEWWKVSSPVHLNNILYECNIKAPMLFNSAVMMSHFKYRHLIIGIYSDSQKGKEYIVCGVPAVYNVDEKPFGDICRWVQLEGNRPRYGAFGYWLVFIR